MVLADYNRSCRRDENGLVASNSIDASSPIENSTVESRTRYGASFAAASEGGDSRKKDKKSISKPSRFRSDRLKKQKPPRIGDMIATPMTYLTSRQRKRIVDTWKSITDRRQLGQRIYMQVFMHKPSLKMATVKCKHLTRWILLVTQTLFSFRDIPVGQLQDNAYFNRQSAIFTDFLNSVVDFVQSDSENLLRDLCHRVGVRHAQFTSVDFEPDWWRVFVAAALDCLQPYFPPRQHNSDSDSGAGSLSRRSVSAHVVAQLPFVGQWLRDSYKQAWTILLEHAAQLMSEAFTNYRTRGPSAPEGESSTQDKNDQCRNANVDGRRCGIYAYSDVGELSRDQYDEYEDQVELQCIIVTTPIEDYLNEDDDHREIDRSIDNGDHSEELVEEEQVSDSSMRQTTTAPETSCCTTSFSFQQSLVPPRSWETTRKRVLRLSSLEDWDSQD